MPAWTSFVLPIAWRRRLSAALELLGGEHLCSAYLPSPTGIAWPWRWSSPWAFVSSPSPPAHRYFSVGGPAIRLFGIGFEEVTSGPFREEGLDRRKLADAKFSVHTVRARGHGRQVVADKVIEGTREASVGHGMVLPTRATSYQGTTWVPNPGFVTAFQFQPRSGGSQ